MSLGTAGVTVAVRCHCGQVMSLWPADGGINDDDDNDTDDGDDDVDDNGLADDDYFVVMMNKVHPARLALYFSQVVFALLTVIE